ncbi:TPA: hypothetical protein ACPYU1_003825, partial [Raoultella planticola]
PFPQVHKFHLREALAKLSVAEWHAAFREIWRRLPETRLPSVEVVPLHRWREAISASRRSGGQAKIVLDFTADVKSSSG